MFVFVKTLGLRNSMKNLSLFIQVLKMIKSIKETFFYSYSRKNG